MNWNLTKTGEGKISIKFFSRKFLFSSQENERTWSFEKHVGQFGTTVKVWQLQPMSTSPGWVTVFFFLKIDICSDLTGLYLYISSGSERSEVAEVRGSRSARIRENEMKKKTRFTDRSKTNAEMIKHDLFLIKQIQFKFFPVCKRKPGWKHVEKKKTIIRSY